MHSLASEECCSEAFYRGVTLHSGKESQVTGCEETAALSDWWPVSLLMVEPQSAALLSVQRPGSTRKQQSLAVNTEPGFRFHYST